MSQPVKLSDALVLDARLAGEAQERSIAGQVEFWAALGKSMELLLNGREVMTLRRSGGTRSLFDALASVETPQGRRCVAQVLAGQPYPHFRQAPGKPGLLIRIAEDGSEASGRFVNREFVVCTPEKAEKTRPAPRAGQAGHRSSTVVAAAKARPAARTKRPSAWA